jgi:hypothetical protein
MTVIVNPATGKQFEDCNCGSCWFGRRPHKSIHRCQHPDVNTFFAKNPFAPCSGHTSKIVPTVSFPIDNMIVIRKT